MANTFITSIDFIGKLQDAGVIPKELHIRRLTLTADVDGLLEITYETYLNKVTANFILEELVKNKDKLVAKKVAERMKV
jgi:hypothetical protein